MNVLGELKSRQARFSTPEVYQFFNQLSRYILLTGERSWSYSPDGWISPAGNPFLAVRPG
jgi:hypothetical protein